MITSETVLQQRYRIGKQIGQGGMGAVYVATDERFGSTVAIKETLCMDDNFRKAIEREARLLNSLKHTALPRVTDHFEEDNILFIVMEFIPGDDVAAMLEKDHRPFSVDKVLKWADQLLDALDYLHNQELPVIHRDIKPQNLKINSRYEMILLDFGLAKGNPADSSHQTAAKSIFGYSRNYASLEQIQGTGTDPRSDLYSLAATLYHMVTGVPPEDALTRAMSVLSKKADPMVPAHVVNADIPPGVSGILQQALDLDANERPASASMMRQMLREHEQYSCLVEAQAVSGISSVPATSGQQTQLVHEATLADRDRQTEAKTRLMSPDVSELTSVGSSPATDPTSAGPAGLSRRIGLGAAVVAIVVGIGLAGGLYTLDPSIFGAAYVDNDAQQVPVSSDLNAPPEANVEAATAETEDGNTNTAISAETLPNASASSVAANSKPGQTARTNKAQTTNESDHNDPEDPAETVNVEMDDEHNPKQIVITERGRDGRVKVTRVNPNAYPVNVNPFPNGFDFERLNEEQRRRVRDAMRKVPRPPVPTPPNPEP